MRVEGHAAGLAHGRALVHACSCPRPTLLVSSGRCDRNQLTALGAQCSIHRPDAHAKRAVSSMRTPPSRVRRAARRRCPLLRRASSCATWRPSPTILAATSAASRAS
eukprot:82232-Pleurochrysis_carterae.AAC.5